MTAQPEQFTTKPNHVEGYQWDGTAEGATVIIDWVLAAGGTARYDDPDPAHPQIHVDRDFGYDELSKGDWLLRNIQRPENGFYMWPGEAFDECYDRIPNHNDYARIYTDAQGEWRYRVFAGNHRLIAASEDGKSTRQGVLRELTREWPQIQNISEERKP